MASHTPAARGHEVVKVGGPLSRYPIRFSQDGKVFFCCSGPSIKLMSVLSGEKVATLTGHSARVVGVVPSPTNKLQLYSASHDGTVKVWDYYDNVCLHTYTIGAPIEHLAVCHVPGKRGQDGRTLLFLVTDRKHYKHREYMEPGRSSRVVSFDPATGELTQHYKSKACVALAASPRGDFVASISQRTLTVWDVKRQRKIKHVHTHSLTTLRFHPTEPYVATGDEKGQIVLWHDFASSSEEGSKTAILHWHAHAVRSLTFSDDGSYLLSGGDEAVLVLWQLDTGHKQFLPRLGSAITHITVSPDGNLYALSGADNCVRMVSAVSSKVERQVQGLQHAHADPAVKGRSRALMTGLVVEPRNKLLVLGGMPGSLQFFDAFADRHVAALDLAPRNTTSAPDQQLMATTRVEHVAFNGEGTWMATTERRTDLETSDVNVLKLWRWNNTSQQYVLHTRVNEPHKGRVVGLAFHPSRNLLVTSSVDKTFKTWQEVAIGGQDGSTSSMRTPNFTPNTTKWVAANLGCYRQYEVSDVAFSQDGSLLAVVYGQVITLWDPFTLTLRHALVHPPPSEHVRWVRFVSNSPFLVAATSCTLYVWNLLTLSVWWSYRLPVLGMAVDHQTGNFAVMVELGQDDTTQQQQQQEEEGQEDDRSSRKSNKRKRGAGSSKRKEDSGLRVILFNVNEPVPLAVWQLHDVRVELRNSQKTADLAFVYPRTNSGAEGVATQAQPGSLLYLNTRKELVRLDGVQPGAAALEGVGLHSDEQQQQQQDGQKSVRAEEEELSLFEQIYGKAVLRPQRPSREADENGSAAMDAEEEVEGNALARAVDGLFRGPAHAAPGGAPLLQAYINLVAPRVKEGAMEAGEGAESDSDGEDSGDAAMKDDNNGDDDGDDDDDDSASGRGVADEVLLAEDTRQGFFQWAGEPYNALVDLLEAKVASRT